MEETAPTVGLTMFKIKDRCFNVMKDDTLCFICNQPIDIGEIQLSGNEMIDSDDISIYLETPHRLIVQSRIDACLKLSNTLDEWIDVHQYVLDH